MSLHTYQYRIKDSQRLKVLGKKSSIVNTIWNFINNTNKQGLKKYKSGEKANGFLGEYDFNNLLAGSSKLLKIHSDTIQEISKSFITARNNTKRKFNLKYRSFKRNLGWIPFKGRSIQLDKDSITYLGTTYRFWNSRPLPADAVIKTGSFNQNSQGKWFVNITFESNLLDSKHNNPSEIVGIDLGIKSAMTLSDGTTEFVSGFSKIYKQKLALAQRAKKKKLVNSINLKIANCRKDELHKITTKIAKKYGNIAIGNVSSQDIVDISCSKEMRSAVYDSGWYMIKSFLKYKAKKLGGIYQEVNEAYSTQTCNVCGNKSGPKGTAGLKVRSWKCMVCDANHDRDINASLNVAKKFIENNKLAVVANDNYSDSKNKLLRKVYSVLDVRLLTEQSL